MESSYEIFYDCPRISSDINDLLTVFEFSNFHDISLIVSNSLFRLYSSVLFNNEHKYKDVYLLEFLIFPCDKKNEAYIRSALVNSQRIVQNHPEFHYFYLKRIGYCLNKDKNTINLVYLNNGNKLIDLKQIYKDSENPKLLILMQFNFLLDFYIKHYENSSNFILLHPQLIFESKICGFQMIDYSLADIFVDYPFNIDNFTIASNFGLYDPEVLDNLNGDNKEIIRNSADIFLLSAFLAYLFSFDLKKEDIDSEKINNNYNYLLFKIRSDFNCKNTRFKLFLDCIKDKEVKTFLSEILNLNYKDVASIYKFKQLFSAILVENNLSKVNCFIKNCPLKAERLNFICRHFLCSSCYKTHIECKNFEPKKLIHDKNKYIFADDNFNKIKIIKEIIYDLKHQGFIQYFEENVKVLFLRIQYDQEKVGRYIKMMDTKLNDMTYYVDKLVRHSFRPKYEQLKAFQKLVEIEISKFDQKFKKSLQSASIANNFNQTETFQPISKITSEDEVKLIDNPSALKILAKEEKDKNSNKNELKRRKKYENFITIYDKFEDYFRGFTIFLEKVKIIKNKINQMINQEAPFVKLSDQECSYYDQLTKEFSKEFKKISLLYEEELFRFHNKAELYESPENNILELNRITETKMMASLDWNKDIMYVYNFKDNADAKLKLNYPADDFEPKKILRHSRWINLGGKLLVTGGMWKKDNREVTSKLTFYINILKISDSGIDNERDVIKLNDMLFEREQHCIIQVNSFYIAVIGGSKVECEMYNILKNEWKLLPSLPEIITNASAVLFNKTNIYLFYGIRGVFGKTRYSEFNPDIYRLKLFSNEEWEMVSNESNKMQMSNFSILNYKDEYIFILGGKISFDLEESKNNSKNIYDFDTEKNRIELSKYLLPKPVCFFESNFISIGNDEFGLYSTDYHLVRLKL